MPRLLQLLQLLLFQLFNLFLLCLRGLLGFVLGFFALSVLRSSSFLCLISLDLTQLEAVHFGPIGLFLVESHVDRQLFFRHIVVL